MIRRVEVDARWSRGRIAAITVACVFGALLIAVLGWLITGADPDSLSGWVGAAATLGALAGAVLAAAYASRAFQLERLREQHRSESDRRAQASLVAGWLDFAALEVSGPPHWSVGAIHIILRNASELPVTTVRFDVLLLSRLGDGEVGEQHLEGAQLSVLPPTPKPRRIDWNDNPAVTQAQHEFTARGQQARERFGLELLFTDSSGIHWKRDWRGRLSEVTSGD